MRAESSQSIDRRVASWNTVSYDILSRRDKRLSKKNGGFIAIDLSCILLSGLERKIIRRAPSHDGRMR